MKADCSIQPTTVWQRKTETKALIINSAWKQLTHKCETCGQGYMQKINLRWTHP